MLCYMFSLHVNFIHLTLSHVLQDVDSLLLTSWVLHGVLFSYFVHTNGPKKAN